jgi:pseudoazurin
MKIWSRTLAAAMLAAGAMAAGGALAAEHEVRMLDRGEGGTMVFEPALLRIAPGDTVRFRATHPGHNAEALQVMTPEGAPLFKGRINEEIAITFDRPGVYGYQCKPHYGLGIEFFHSACRQVLTFVASHDGIIGTSVARMAFGGMLIS